MSFLLSLNDLTVNKPWNDKMIYLIYNFKHSHLPLN